MPIHMVPKRGGSVSALLLPTTCLTNQIHNFFVWRFKKINRSESSELEEKKTQRKLLLLKAAATRNLLFVTFYLELLCFTEKKTLTKTNCCETEMTSSLALPVFCLTLRVILASEHSNGVVLFVSNSNFFHSNEFLTLQRQQLIFSTFLGSVLTVPLCDKK